MAIDLVTVWAILSSVGMVVFGYLNYRKAEVVVLGMEVVKAYADKAISEEEYKIIVDKLGAVLYKK